MTDLLSAADVNAALHDLGDWTGDTTVIRRTAVLPTFMAAIGVVSEVAAVAEELDHHPDIDIRWRTLVFECSTHSANGVTAKDLELASRIERILTAATHPAPTS